MKTAVVVLALALGGGAASAAESPEIAAILKLQQEGKFAEAESAARRLIETSGAAHGPDSEPVAEALDALIPILRDTGKAAEPASQDLARRAVALREMLHGPDDPRVAKSLSQLSNLLRRAGDLPAALAAAERSLAIRERALPPDHPDVVRSLSSLGNVTLALGEESRALDLFARALSIQEKIAGPDDFRTAVVRHNYAGVLRQTGDYEQARIEYERALAAIEKSKGPDHFEVAPTLDDLVILYIELGDYRTALGYAQRSAPIIERSYGPGSPQMATTLNQQAVLFNKMGDVQKADEASARALRIHETVFGAGNIKLIPPLVNRAAIHLGKGAPDEAVVLLRRALRIVDGEISPDHHWTATILNDLGESLRQQGKTEEAAPALDRALKIFSKVAGSDDPRTAEVVNNLGKLRRDNGDLEGAVELGLRAETIGRRLFERTARGLSEREALAYERTRVSGLSVALAGLVGGAAGPTSVARVWDEVIRSRALVLDEMISRQRAVPDGERQPAGPAGALAAARRRLARLVVRGPSGDSYPDDVTRAQNEVDQAERALAAASVPYHRALNTARAGLDAVRRRLPPHAGLVSYVSYAWPAATPQDRPTAYLAFVLRPGSADPVAVPLGAGTDVDALIETWRRDVSRDPRASSGGDAHWQSGERLRRAVWDPVLERLGRARKVFVVTDGGLNLVNIAALPAPGKGYLVETGPLLYHVSIERDLVGDSGPAGPSHRLLVLGGPDFDAASGPPSVPSAAATAGPAHATRSACADFRSLRFDAIPAAREEAREVAGLWERQGGDVVVLTGAEAAEGAFKRLAPGRDVLHVATHGFFVEGACGSSLHEARRSGRAAGPNQDDGAPPAFVENPLLLSGLALAGANRRDSAAAGAQIEDGILTAAEIAALDLSGVGWTVLSACETGTGRIEAREGVLGLRRAFQMAGARALIMSLWAVEDEATRAFMNELHRARLNGLEPADALRRSARAIIGAQRRAGRSDHPFFWGGFIASGI